MNQTAKAARFSFYVKGDDSNPNQGQPVSKADEKQSTVTTVSPYYYPFSCLERDAYVPRQEILFRSCSVERKFY